MHFYQHNIGDFDKSTRHLSRIERSVYRDLIEFYYDIEEPLPLDLAAVCRKIIAKTNEESTAVEQVLNEFFNETPIGWYHIRCEEEIERFHCSTSQKSEAGKASAAKKREKLQQALNGKSTSVEQTFNGASTKQEPITNNQEPIKTDAPQAATVTEPKFDFVKNLAECGAEEKAIVAWMKVRKIKRATNSIFALDAFKREAAKAGLSISDAVLICAERSWSGLDADWLKPKSHGSPQRETIEQKNARIRAEVMGQCVENGMTIEMES